ncbi:MAG: ABC transporter ATP-binding protein [Verrucomicrobiales bacterium]|nr:ABC transporter ATP-binding protein [Verrucomicrobiales bacterium]
MIFCRKLEFRYPGESVALSFPEFSVEAGETVALIGPSGCGKTTLLNLISGILVPDEGVIEVGGEQIQSLELAARQSFRLRNIGLVPQNFELLDYLTVRENILLPLRLLDRGRIEKAHENRVEELAEKTGISPLLNKLPSRLSQGERQRAALCRGLVGKPPLILADEPTGNLDTDNQDRIVSLLLEEAGALKSSVIMITHEPSLYGRFDRVENVMSLRMEGGE